MALLAVASHLPAMKIGMTIGALVSNMGKNKIDMALAAGEPGVHSLKRERRVPMIEFWRGPESLPSFRCVAFLAGYFDIPMGAGGSFLSA